MLNIQLIRTNSNSEDFQELVNKLDHYLAIRNGIQNDFFTQFNSLENLKEVVVAYLDAVPVGCGAMKKYDEKAMEIKRMFVPLGYRGRGIASSILTELETWAKELGYTQTILETGKDMEDAVKLYKNAGYQMIPNYEPYADVNSSCCFKKQLKIV